MTWHKFIFNFALSVKHRFFRHRRTEIAVRNVCRALATSVSMDEPRDTDELDAVVVQLEKCAAIISNRYAVLLRVQAAVVEEWIPRLAAAVGQEGATPSVYDLIEEGTLLIGEVERLLASAPRELGSPPDTVGVGLTRIHEWIFLAEKESPKEMRGLLSRLSKQIVQLMASVVITPIISSGRFDPQTQSVVEVTDTQDQALDHCISDTIRPGYLYRGGVLKLEQVAVFKFKQVQPDVNPESKIVS